MRKKLISMCITGTAERSKKWGGGGGGGAEAGGRDEWGGVGVFDKEYPS